MSQPAKRKYTYSDYLLTPEDKRFELIEGDLIMVPAPGTFHQRIVLNLAKLLDNFVRQQKLGFVFTAPCDVVLDKFTVVQPDILFIREENKQLITQENIKGAPDLVVEVISPASAYVDIVKKKQLYAHFGVPEYWLVNPEEQKLEIFTLVNKEYVLDKLLKTEDLLVSSLIPGFKVPVREIFL